MKRPLIGLHRYLLMEPEELLWQMACLLTLLLAGLKVGGLLQLSWWWILLPVLLPSMLIFALFLVAIVAVLCFKDDWT